MLDILLVPAAHQSLISPLQEKNLSKSLLVKPWLFSMWWSPMSRSTCKTILLCHFDIVMCETSKTSNSDVWNLQDKEGKLVDLLHQLLDREAHLVQLVHWYEFVANLCVDILADVDKVIWWKAHKNFSFLVPLSLLRVFFCQHHHCIVRSKISVNTLVLVCTSSMLWSIMWREAFTWKSWPLQIVEDKEKFSPQPFPSCQPASASAPPSIGPIVTFSMVWLDSDWEIAIPWVCQT